MRGTERNHKFTSHDRDGAVKFVTRNVDFYAGFSRTSKGCDVLGWHFDASIVANGFEGGGKSCFHGWYFTGTRVPLECHIIHIVSGGISAIQGFDYQAVTTLDVLLCWFEQQSFIRARPEGVDDLTVEFKTDLGIRQNHYQIKKPSEASGKPTGTAWTISDIVTQLLLPTIARLEDNTDHQEWILGDPIHEGFGTLLQVPLDTSLKNSQIYLRVIHT